MSAISKQHFKTKIEKQPRTDILDQHLFAFTTTYSQENVLHFSHLKTPCPCTSYSSGRIKDRWPVVLSNYSNPFGFTLSWNKVVPEKYIILFLSYNTLYLRWNQIRIKKTYNWVKSALTCFCSIITPVTVNLSLQGFNGQVLKRQEASISDTVSSINTSFFVGNVVML